jgi:hypothetical protein
MALCCDTSTRSMATDRLAATEDTAAAAATAATLDLRNPVERSKISVNVRWAREGKRLEKWIDMGW